MVGKISVIPRDSRYSQFLDFFANSFSYYKIRIDDFVWIIAISPVVKRVRSVRKLSGVGNLEVVIDCDVNNSIIEEIEVLNLGYDARTKLCSTEVVDLLKKVDRWELDV